MKKDEIMVNKGETVVSNYEKFMRKFKMLMTKGEMEKRIGE